MKKIKMSLLIPVAGLLMGNKSCEKPAAEGPRQLKKIVNMGAVRSPAIQLPGGQYFDFAFVANQQLYGILAEDGNFALKQRQYVQDDSQAGVGLFKLSSNDFKAVQKSIPSKVDLNKGALVVSKEAACMVNLPMAKVDASINAFELMGGGGIRIGFSPTGAHGADQINAGIGFNVESAQMDVSMRANNPLSGNPMAAVNVNANQTKTRIDASIMLGMFSLGPSYFYQTPLASVTKSALTKAVAGLATGFEKYEWSSRVMYQLDDKEVFIVGGLDLNLKPGDEFGLFNEEYMWTGEPCASYTPGGGGNTPVAVLRLEWVGDEVSKGYLTKQTFENVREGAKVRLLKRVEDAEPRKDIATDHLVDTPRP